MKKLHNFYIFIILILVSFFIRAGLFYRCWNNLRHGSALVYGSVAIGLFSGNDLTFNSAEILKIRQERNNYSGNYLKFHESRNRQEFFVFLPGPAILLNLLWRIVPIFNFAPYILFQIFLDSLLILLFYLFLKTYDKLIAFITTILMIFNLATIRVTLTMGYDFWPQFFLLVSFIGIFFVLERKRGSGVLLIIGVLTALTVWFRSITTFLPFFIAVFLFIYYKFVCRLGLRPLVSRLTCYLFPIVLAILLLGVYRYNLTGNFRPTRSTFWHSFFAGVSQFSNPYDLEHSDRNIWEFGKKLNCELENYTLGDMYKLPNSPYEQTLKKEAFSFIRKYPNLFIRNFFYRIAIMISPLWYTHGEFIPQSLSPYLFPFGFIIFFLWFFGMYYVFQNHKLLFWLSLTIYLYFFMAFGWFYVVGRVILPFLFINIFIYLFGMKFVVQIIRRKSAVETITNQHPIIVQ